MGDAGHTFDARTARRVARATRFTETETREGVNVTPPAGVGFGAGVGERFAGGIGTDTTTWPVRVTGAVSPGLGMGDGVLLTADTTLTPVGWIIPDPEDEDTDPVYLLPYPGQTLRVGDVGDARLVGERDGRAVYAMLGPADGSGSGSGSGAGNPDDGCVDSPGLCPVWYTAYHHLESWDVRVGQSLAPRTPIGLIKPYATGAHSHFSLGDGSDFLKLDPVMVCGQTLDIAAWTGYLETGARDTTTAKTPLYYPPFTTAEAAYIQSVFENWLLPTQEWKIFYGSVWHSEGEYYALDVMPADMDPFADPPDQSMRGTPVYLAIKEEADVVSTVLYAQQVSAEAGGIVIVKHRRKCCATDEDDDHGSGSGDGSNDNLLNFQNVLKVATDLCLTLPPVAGSGSGEGSGGGAGSGTDDVLYDGLDHDVSAAIAKWIMRQIANDGYDGTKFPLAAKKKTANLYLPIGINFAANECEYTRACDVVCPAPDEPTGYCTAMSLTTGNTLPFAGYDAAGYPTWADAEFEIYFDVALGGYVLEDFGTAGFVLRVPSAPGWLANGPALFEPVEGSVEADDIGVDCEGSSPVYDETTCDILWMVGNQGGTYSANALALAGQFTATNLVQSVTVDSNGPNIVVNLNVGGTEFVGVEYDGTTGEFALYRNGFAGTVTFAAEYLADTSYRLTLTRVGDLWTVYWGPPAGPPVVTASATFVVGATVDNIVFGAGEDGELLDVCISSEVL